MLAIDEFTEHGQIVIVYLEPVGPWPSLRRTDVKLGAGVGVL
jgi:hypothetical protein